ncbi:MAG: arginine--tRNA ligase [Clostridia bacterium]|nr:arginine--tRNA ligase [Clostridia bacterium]
MTRNIAEQSVFELRQAILDALGKAVADGKLPAEPIPEFKIEVPADRTHGDYAANVAMVSARAFRMAPRAIAEIIVANLDLNTTMAQSAEIAGAGFINFRLAPRFYAGVLAEIQKQSADYGRSDFGGGKKVDVEFVSANPTGPMHIGNARGGALGDSLASVLEAAGYEVCREFYINDAGNQINKFGLSLETRYLQLFDDSIEMPEDAYHGQDIIDHAKAFADLHGESFVHADPDERKAALVAYALPLNIAGLERDLKKYRIEYDVWFKESTIHADGGTKKIVDLLTEKGHTYESEGAVWFKGSDFGTEDFVLMRSNGIPTYVVPDIAYHYNKLVTRGFDKAIDVLGADHHGYVPRLKAALQALDVDPARLHVVLMQMVRLVQGGETIKLSKRSGKAITLVTLLEEVPIDAARFFFNLREPNTHCEFDLDLAVEQSSENPVYYVQYAHARICSILKNLAAEGIVAQTLSAKEMECLTEPAEMELIRHLSALPAEIVESAEAMDPSKITRYAMELATLFHKFYNACRVKGNDQALTLARLALCVCVKQTLNNILSLLKIDAPETM